MPVRNDFVDLKQWKEAIQQMKQQNINLNLLKPDDVGPAADAVVDDMFEYHRWSEEQIQQGIVVRMALAVAVKTIIRSVPASPDRSAAIRKLREARMDCNSAISHDGRY